MYLRSEARQFRNKHRYPERGDGATEHLKQSEYSIRNRRFLKMNIRRLTYSLAFLAGHLARPDAIANSCSSSSNNSSGGRWKPVPTLHGRHARSLPGWLTFPQINYLVNRNPICPRKISRFLVSRLPCGMLIIIIIHFISGSKAHKTQQARRQR